MTDHPKPEFHWRDDAFGSWEVGIAALREWNIRSGQIAPSTPEEEAWQREGPVPPEQLQAGRR
jgi:hypothetical protein